MGLVLLVGLGLAAVAVVVGAWYAGLGLKEGMTKARWPKTEATVRGSTVSSVSDGSRYGGTFFRYSVEFDYVVDLAPLGGSFYCDKQKNFNALRDKYKDGTVFDLFYNPGTPSHTEVRDGLGQAKESAWFGIAVMCFAAAGFTVCLAWFVDLLLQRP